MPTPPVVAVVNTNPDLVDLLKESIEVAGFVVFVLQVAQIRSGMDVAALVAQHDPQVIVYDVVAPMQRSWRFLEHLRETAFKGRRFVLTSPNVAALERIIGKDEKIYEIVDEGDLRAIVQAVREAARSRPTA